MEKFNLKKHLQTLEEKGLLAEQTEFRKQYALKMKGAAQPSQEQQALNVSAFSDQQLDKVDKKSNKPLHGIAAQYRDKLTTCKFKLICYYNQKKDGSFYSVAEKQMKKHRRPIPSIDIYNGISGVVRTDHEIAYNSLLTYCLQNAARLEKAMLIVNDYASGEELTILLFNPQVVIASQSVQPVFKDVDNGRIYCGLDGNPLRVDKMRFSD